MFFTLKHKLQYVLIQRGLDQTSQDLLKCTLHVAPPKRPTTQQTTGAKSFLSKYIDILCFNLGKINCKRLHWQ